VLRRLNFRLWRPRIRQQKLRCVLPPDHAVASTADGRRLPCVGRHYTTVTKVTPATTASTGLPDVSNWNTPAR
jgi:hypothetical protein